MPPTQLLRIQQKFGVSAEVKHAHEAPHTAHIVVLLWCRPPVASFSHSWWFIFCSGNGPFVSSIDCSVHEGDPRKLHLMNTAHLNEKKIHQPGSNRRQQRKILQTSNTQEVGFCKIRAGWGWMDANSLLPGTNFPLPLLLIEISVQQIRLIRPIL